ncbi:MAG: hypothetical protein KGZ93_07795 [Actinobacteria bacterium]|nr:hypothetical protein [Actinomycetota bacterium]
MAMNERESTLNANHAAKKPAKGKRILTIVIVVVVLAAALFGGGWRQGRAQVAAQKADYESRLQAVEDELAQTQERLAAQMNRALLMEARAALYRSAIDLDRRNFGIATTHLREAATALGKIDDVNGGLDQTRLNALQSAIAETDINVAVNLEEQRAKILGFTEELDALVSESTDR